jgi:hypothetical protein
VGSFYRYIDEEDHQVAVRTLPRESGEIKKALLETNQFAHAAVMFTAKAIDTVGPYREFFTYAQDYDLFLRISERFDVYNIPVILLEWRLSLDSASVKYRPLQRAYAKIAVQCSLERRTGGSDPLDREDYSAEEIETLKQLTTSSFSSWLKKRAIKARSYYQWASYFYYLENPGPPRRYYVIRLLLRSFWENPFLFILFISETVLNALKRLLNSHTGITKEEREGG